MANYRVHIFKSSNNFTVAPLIDLGSDYSNVEYMIVAGGGGGGVGTPTNSIPAPSIPVVGHATGGGGGGAGGMIVNNFPASSNTYVIQVGAGGAGGAVIIDAPAPARTHLQATNGTESNISLNGTIINSVRGGGRGGDWPSIPFTPRVYGGDGGSGGGGSGRSPVNPGPAFGGTAFPVFNQGNPGGVGVSDGVSAPLTGAGGGGGAGGAGGAGSLTGSLGGLGRLSNITGSSIFYAGGGAGSRVIFPGTPGLDTKAPGPAGGGPGGGGGAGNPWSPEDSGNTNTGGGGCGRSFLSVMNGPAGSGGSGLVVLRYLKPPVDLVFSTRSNLSKISDVELLPAFETVYISGSPSGNVIGTINITNSISINIYGSAGGGWGANAPGGPPFPGGGGGGGAETQLLGYAMPVSSGDVLQYSVGSASHPTFITKNGSVVFSLNAGANAIASVAGQGGVKGIYGSHAGNAGGSGGARFGAGAAANNNIGAAGGGGGAGYGDNSPVIFGQPGGRGGNNLLSASPSSEFIFFRANGGAGGGPASPGTSVTYATGGRASPEAFAGGGGGAGGGVIVPAISPIIAFGAGGGGGGGIGNIGGSGAPGFLAIETTLASSISELSYIINTLKSYNGEIFFYTVNNQPNSAFVSGNTGYFEVNGNVGNIVLYNTASFIYDQPFTMQVRRNSTTGTILFEKTSNISST